MHPACAALVGRVAWLVAALGLAAVRAPHGGLLAAGAVILAFAGWVAVAVVGRVERVRAWALALHERAARGGLAYDLRERLPRAESLAVVAAVHGESRELAALHLQRLVARVDWAAFDARAEYVAGHLRRAARVAMIALVSLVVVRWEPILEGVAVLTARGGEARFTLPFARSAALAIRAPSYLRVPDASAPFEGEVVVFAGSEVELRFSMRASGVEPVLMAGDVRLAPANDGQGAFVLRRPVSASETWRLGRVVADVFVPEGAEVRIETSRDALPVVALEGAPKQMLLGETDREGGVAIAYEVEDDHGLREVHLVLRAGAMEERRPLATLDGERRRDRGAAFVRTADSFFRKAIGPVELRVEARDDGREGVRWGRSEAIVVVPPALGTAEAERFKMLATLRDHVIDRLARRLGSIDSSGSNIATWLVDLEDEREEIEATLSTSTLGLLVPGGIRTAVRREAQRLLALAEVLPKRDGDASRKAIVDATEALAWRLDLELRQLGWSDARAVARRIGQQVQVAADAIQSAAPASLGDDLARLDAAGRTLRTLGPLGRDLGDLVEGEAFRARGRLAEDPQGAKFLLAALARRLARPDPSFGAKGSGKGGSSDGRAEAGGDGASGSSGSAGGEAGDGEGSEGGAAAGKRSPIDDLADRQQSLRRAAEAQARGPGDEAAEREEHARQLQDLAGAEEFRHREGEARLRRAAEDVRRGALGAARDEVERAERLVPKGSSRERAVLKNRLRDEMAWLDERAHGDPRALAEEQRALAEEARRARGGAKDERASKALEQSVDAMERAARALREGTFDRAIAAQGESLGHLEAARDAQRGEEGRGGDDSAHAAVPVQEERRAAAWRRRVLEGLSGRGGSRDPEAVQRYEEGLLR